MRKPVQKDCVGILFCRSLSFGRDSESNFLVGRLTAGGEKGACANCMVMLGDLKHAQAFELELTSQAVSQPTATRLKGGVYRILMLSEAEVKSNSDTESWGLLALGGTPFSPARCA